MIVLLGWALNIAAFASGVSIAVPASAAPQEAASPAKLNSTEISVLEAAAQKGDVAAEVKLGKAYLHGDGIAKNDELAAKWFRKAADQFDPTAENQLANMYRSDGGNARQRRSVSMV